MVTRNAPRQRLFRMGGFTYRWFKPVRLADDCNPDNIVVGDFAFRQRPDGRPELRRLTAEAKAGVVLLIAAENKKELDRMRREELAHEADVDAYESSIPGDQYESHLEGGDA